MCVVVISGIRSAITDSRLQRRCSRFQVKLKSCLAVTQANVLPLRLRNLSISKLLRTNIFTDVLKSTADLIIESNLLNTGFQHAFESKICTLIYLSFSYC